MLQALLGSPGVTSFLGGVGKGIGQGAAPAGPSNASAAAYGTGQDGSGWSVNFSGIQSATSSQDKSGGVPGFGSSGVGSPLGLPWWAWAAVAGAVVWRLRKSRQ